MEGEGPNAWTALLEGGPSAWAHLHGRALALDDHLTEVTEILCFCQSEGIPIPIRSVRQVDSTALFRVWVGTSNQLHRYDGLRGLFRSCSEGLIQCMILSLRTDEQRIRRTNK